MTDNKFIEVMSVPVLSTAHLPSNEAIEEAPLLVAPYEGGWFMYLDRTPPEGEPFWVAPIRDWAKRICPSCDWVRFDMDADIIHALEKFTW